MNRLEKIAESIKRPFTPQMMTPLSSVFDLAAWFIQRGWRGFSDWDASECSGFLADVLAKTVRFYAENLEKMIGGCPAEFAEEDYKGPSWQEFCRAIAYKLEVGADWLNDRTPDWVHENGAELPDWLPDYENEKKYGKSEAFEQYCFWANKWEAAAKKQWEEGMRLLIEWLPGMWV